MSKVTTFLLATVFVTSSAFAGSVSITPASVDPAFRGDVLLFDVSINGPIGFDGFNSTSLTVGSSMLRIDGIDAFVYSAEFLSAVTISDTAIPNPLPDGMNFALAFGGLNFFADALSAPIIVGTLTVIVPDDIEFGLYTVEGFGEITNSAGSDAEFLDRGIATVNVVPEPATLVLLGIGGIAAMRRRRR